MNTPNGLWCGATARSMCSIPQQQSAPAGHKRYDEDALRRFQRHQWRRGLWVKSDESLFYYASGTKVRQWTPAGGTSSLNKQFNDLGNLILKRNQSHRDRSWDDTVWLVATNQGTRYAVIWDERRYESGCGWRAGADQRFVRRARDLAVARRRIFLALIMRAISLRGWRGDHPSFREWSK